MLDNVEILVRELYKTKKKLIDLHENKKLRWSFTLDGNLVGDIGELIVCHHFDLEPLPKGEKTHDAISKDGKRIQIKTTQGNQVGLGLEKRNFDYLIVVKIDNDGKYQIIYNGPGRTVWDNTKSLSISIKKLAFINQQICEQDRVRIVRS